MVSPSIIRKSSGSNEAFFLKYDAVNGFMTALPSVTVLNPANSTTVLPSTIGPNDIVTVDGPDSDAGTPLPDVTVDVTGDVSLLALKTDQTLAGPGFTIKIGSGGLIFFQGNNQNRTIEPNVDFGNVEGFISGREGGGDFTANLGNKNRDTLAGTVSGTKGFTKFAGGDLHLSGNNTITGPITVQRGRLVIDGGNGIGTGAAEFGGDGRNNPLTLNANTAAYNNNSNHHPTVFDLGGNLQSVDGLYGTGSVQSLISSAPLIIDKSPANGGTATFSGTITGGIQVYKRGTGTQILAPGAFGDNTYDSGTNVEAGTLLVNNTSGSGTGPGVVSVSSGATLGGSGSIDGFTGVQNGGHIAPGAGPGKVGTLTVGGLTLDTSILDYEGDGSGVDRLNVGTGGFGLSGVSTINISNLGGLAGGDYILIDYSSGNADTSNFTLGPAPAGYTLSLLNDIDNTNLVLHVVSSGPPQWALDANGQWGTAANWIGGSPNSPTAIANFLGKITAPRTITLDGSKQVQEIHFDNANKYTIAAGTGTLTVGNGATGTIEVVSAPPAGHEISAPLTLAGAVAKTGPGTLTISGPQSHIAGSSLAVNAGQLNLNSNAGAAAAAASAASAPLAISISGSGSKVVVGADQNLKSLSISTADAGLQGLDLNSPAAAGGFRSIHIYASDLASAKSSLYNAIRNATTNAGDGIFDSGLAAHAGSKIGIAQVADAHGEQNIFIRPTKVGDLNLDGQVSISDFLDLASHFGGNGTWQEGDLNYDGQISISDFLDLASNFGGSYSGAAGAVNSADQQTLASFASSIGVDPAVIGSAVPEPGTLSLLAIGACGLATRRRRK